MFRGVNLSQVAAVRVWAEANPTHLLQGGEMSDEIPTVHNALFVGTCNGEPYGWPFAELLAHHADVRDATARSIHIEHELAPDVATFVSMISFVYAFNTYKALGLLLPHFYHESGAVVFRQLWEVSLNLHWIERDPLPRAQDFCNFTVMEYRKLIQKSGDPSPLQDFDDATSAFQARFRYRDRKGRDQKHSVFATKSTHDRADELGDPWKREYELVYHLASLHAHGAPGAILQPHFRQHYSAPEIREQDSVSLLAILSMNVLVRDLHLLQRLGVIRNCDEVDKAFASFQNTMERAKAAMQAKEGTP
jgi:hypothetical protein